MRKASASASMVLAVFLGSVFALPALARPSAGAVAACMSSGATFGEKVQFVAPGFNPKSAVGAPPTSPPNLSQSVVQNIRQTFQTSFSIAPQFLQDLLCTLDGVYVDVNIGNRSWGYRDQRTFDKRYLALSLSLFDTSGTAESFAAYSTIRINEIFGLLPQQGFYFAPAMHHQTVVDGPEITVLAALAHEAGHIVWYDAMKPGGSYSYRFCNAHFLDDWERIRPTDPWTNFGDLNPSYSEHKSAPGTDNVSVADIQAVLGNAGQLTSILTALEGANSRWATPLGAFTPNEDLVETFQDVVLTYPRAPYALTQQLLYAYGGTTPIGDTFANKGYYVRKKHCFDHF